MEFELINDNEFDLIKSDIIMQENEYKNYKLCIKCDIIMSTNINNKYICNNCGHIKYISTDNLEYESSLKNYNVSSTCHMPIIYKGLKSYKYQQQLRNSTSSYNQIQESSIKKILNNFNTESNGFTISQNIILYTIEKYKEIREHGKVYRGEILKGVLGAIVYYICLKEGLTRKPREIARWCQTSESNLSQGDKNIRKMQEQGIINITINTKVDNDYISSYLKRLNIDISYYKFLNELLYIINDKKIGNTNARTSTKVTSIIYLLCVSKQYDLKQYNNIKENLTNEQIISREFDISESTFKLFYNIILKNKESIIHIFNNYNLVFPTKTSNRKNRKCIK